MLPHSAHVQGEAASLGNKMSIQDANAAKVRELTLQLNAAEEHVMERTQALASANNEIRSLQQVCAMLDPALTPPCQRMYSQGLSMWFAMEWAVFRRGSFCLLRSSSQQSASSRRA